MKCITWRPNGASRHAKAWRMGLGLALLPWLAMAQTATMPPAATSCVACHGPSGQGVAGLGPRLAGLSAAYLSNQIERFRRGQRQSPTMTPMATALPDAQAIAQVSAYFASLPAPANSTRLLARGDVVAPATQVGKLVLQGDWARNLPACFTCHGSSGVGVGDTPRLMGQQADYLAKQLRDFKHGLRTGDPAGAMTRVAQALTEDEIQPLANYFANHATLPSEQATPASRPATMALADIPDTAFGRKVKLGYQLFVNTQQLRGSYVRNSLNCVNCHLDAGRRPTASPIGVAFWAYPAYRKKNNKVNSYQERIQGCFRYSMNGTPPPDGSPELVALSAYSYWLGMRELMDRAGQTGPVPELSDLQLLSGGKTQAIHTPGNLTVEQRANQPTRLFPKLAKPALTPSPLRGAKVYAANCAACHGANGQGASAAGLATLPPLWGAQSYNWGAGMHQINKAANFIYANMPLAAEHTITEQDAWDVAAYINSHDRPQDPRFEGNVTRTAQRFHQHAGYYGDAPNGVVLGSQSPPANPTP